MANLDPRKTLRGGSDISQYHAPRRSVTGYLAAKHSFGEKCISKCNLGTR